MNVRDVLVRQAELAEPPPLDPDVVVARGEQLARRRQRRRVAAVAAALVVTLGAAALLTPEAGRPEPTGPVDVPEWTPGTRPLAYGQGQTLHLGTQQVETGLDFLSIDLTDAGAWLTTADGGIWFSDGDGVERIATTRGGAGAEASSLQFSSGARDWVVTDSAGSLTVWLEFRAGRVDRPELVVHDAGDQVEVARVPLVVTEGNSAQIVALAGREVFVREDERGRREAREPLLRYDVDSGALEPATGNDLAAAVRTAPRALAVGPIGFGMVLGSPEPRVGGPPLTMRVTVTDGKLELLHDPGLGEWIDVAVPGSLARVGDLFFTQWLDDDRFVLATDAGSGDLLLCRISAHGCGVVVEDITPEHRYGPDSGLMPGHGLHGGDAALQRVLLPRNRDTSP